MTQFGHEFDAKLDPIAASGNRVQFVEIGADACPCSSLSAARRDDVIN
jgi:hypothetical protein